MPKTRKFIDRKNAVTFHLVHRSQQDPLTADENAPQRVLLPVKEKPKTDKDKQKLEEQMKFGVFFDDDYNYLQHLKDANVRQVDWEKVERIEAPIPQKINLPSSVFASKVEEDVGLLNKAAPQSGLRLDLDPDVVAAMDEDFNYDDPDNQLEDNFIELATAEGASDDSDSDVGSNSGSDFDSNYTDEEADEVASLNGPQLSFADEETRSRFTDYSMSSSVIRRNEQLSLLDDRFEKMYTGYDEIEIGALDCDEIEGFVDINSDLVMQCADEFARARKREQLAKDAVTARFKIIEDGDSDAEDGRDLVAMKVEEKEKWDCESILTTYSNIYNHPKLISEPKNSQKIKINMKTGMPVNVLGANKLTAKALSQFDAENNQIDRNTGSKSIGAQSIISTLSVLSIRPKDETPEERKERKHNLKEYRKARRLEKKANSEAFKEEAKRQVKISINNKNNIQGNRIL